MKKIVLIFCLFLSGSTLFAQSIESQKKRALNKTESFSDDINNVSNRLWEYGELALKEDKSADLLPGILEEHGFSIERGVAGMPTAFIATYGSGEPTIGTLAEYDALPGVGNAPVSERKPRDDGISSGHGCGHNLFGTGSVYGAIAAKEAMDELGIEGTIKLYGTPAEATMVGKVPLLQQKSSL